MRKVGFAIFISFSFLIHAQQIQSIHFAGLKKTKQTYIRQFLTIAEGEKLDSAKLLLNKQRLANLEMLADVTYQVTGDQDGYIITFDCQELQTILPIFSFGGIEENFWLQAGASEVNLRGRGNKLTAYYQYYDRSSVAIHYTQDRIRQGSWGMNLNLIKWSTLEPLYFQDKSISYEYDNYTLGGNAIRHFNFTDRIEFGGSFFTERYRKTTSEVVEGAPERVEKYKFLGKVTLVWNRVDYFFFYQNGFHNQLNMQTVHSFSDDPAFYIVFNDIKNFGRVGRKGNWATRFRLGLSSNEESPFAPFVLDSYLNIRGVGNRVDRGTGAIILNVEYRHTFYEREKYAIQGVAFSDTGAWRTPGGQFSDFTEIQNVQIFAGTGLRFIHKKIFNAILRVDYGVNMREPSARGFVLGIGQYF